MRGLSVFTRPSRISGKRVYSSTGCASTPSSASSRAVPPVDTRSTPSALRPRANSTSPRLSDTLSSARRIRTSPGAVTPAARSVAIVHQDGARVVRIGSYPPRGYQADGTRQQPVLDAMHFLLDLGDPRRIRKRERLLKDDGPGVHPLVHEMDGHAGHLDPVIDRLLDGADAR